MKHVSPRTLSPWTLRYYGNKLSSLSNATDACVAVSGNKLSSLSKEREVCLIASSNKLSSPPKDPEACMFIVVSCNKLSSLPYDTDACVGDSSAPYRPSPRTLRHV